MTAETIQKEIPSLSELADASFKEIQDYLKYLSLPEVLIIGARPLSKVPRPDSEIRDISEVAKEKLKELEGIKNTIFWDIVNGLYSNKHREVVKQEITDYLGKYEFLIGENAMPRELMEGIEKSIKGGIAGYRDSIQNYRQGNLKHVQNKINELKNLERTPINLVCYSHSIYKGVEPHLIGSKTKAPIRIAGKIPYGMIKGYREKKGKVEGSGFKRNLNLEDGVLRDSVGLQFVTLNLKELDRIKKYIFTSENIEVLVNEKNIPFDDYYKKREGPYHAIHIDVAWNPIEDGSYSSLLFNPHVNSVEIILIEFPYFVGSNFGPASYWRRINAQNIGIVEKYLKNGRLQINKFTDKELEWKLEIQERIMKLFTYGNSNNSRYKS